MAQHFTTSYLEDALRLFHPVAEAGRAGDGAGDRRATLCPHARDQLVAALESLPEVDLARTVTIRGKPHSVKQAIDRQVAHYALHLRRIVLPARHIAGHRWRSLSVPRN
jgi:hypothetical protein